jgi:hypothetical protein
MFVSSRAVLPGKNPGVRRLATNYSTLVWSADGSQVTKSRPPSHDAGRRFRNEMRVNRMLTACPPPVRTPSLLGYETRTRSLTFAALPGEPIGPKYPRDLPTADIDAVLRIARELRQYNPPRRRWMRRLNTERRLALAARLGVLDSRDADALAAVARRHHTRLRFAHGDLVVRNVLRQGADAALIDWEWAGLYPTGYDDAIFWFSLQDVEGGRARVEQAAVVDEASFLLSALVIELWHLQWYVPDEFRARHLATREELVGRLLG